MIKVVIVEDDLMVASINKNFISQTPGLEVVATFHNGKDALVYLEKTKVDLLLLDLYIPNISGLELLATLRSNQNHIDVIMVTAANDVASLNIAMGLGALDYLVKPFQYERFSKAIDRFLVKYKITQNGMSFTQRDIDELIHTKKPSQSSNRQLELSKGLQSHTLELIRSCMKSQLGTYMTSEEISQNTDLSKVTIRRYMNYLIETNEVISEVDYSTGGRPSIKYKYASNLIL